MMDSELVFKALADGTRQRILQVLLQQEVNVSELVGVLDQPQSTISRHLKALRGAGLIVDRREGTTVVYSALGAGPNGDVRAGDLQSRLLEWVGAQALPPAIARRIEAVLHQRRVRSEAFFARVGHQWDQMRVDCFGSAFQYEALTSLLPREWVVADVGTGTGYLLPLLAGRFRRVIAVDPVPAMLEAARTRPDLQGVANVDFRLGDLSRLPMEDAEVDVALATLVLHHVPSPREAVRELSRIIKPGGRLLIVEQSAHEHEEFHERMQDRWWGFDRAKLSAEVARAGFVDVRQAVLASAEPANASAPQAPELFVLTAKRGSTSRGALQPINDPDAEMKNSCGDA